MADKRNKQADKTASTEAPKNTEKSKSKTKQGERGTGTGGGILRMNHPLAKIKID
jgi:hypothetical protein